MPDSREYYTADDKLTAALDGIRKRCDAASRARSSGRGFVAELASAADVPRLIAALEVALSYHQRPSPRRRKGRLVCGADSELMPCIAHAAISRALLGEDAQ
jgi:hypothetical protein